jgi:hypothetical protein
MGGMAAAGAPSDMAGQPGAGNSTM